ncbi:MAG: flagellar motor switch phosphatase FliY [Chitinophagales bacterium]
MNDGILSQEEIDALLRGDSKPISEPTEVSTISQGLNEIEKDALGEIGNISMGTSATTLSTLLGKKVSITTPQVKVTTREELQSDYPLPYVIIEVRYREGLQGRNILVVKMEDASVIADLMMGGVGDKGRELDELTLSALSEAMNQMMGSATTSLSSMFDMKIDIAPPSLMVVDFGKEQLADKVGDQFTGFVQILFRMEIENLLVSEIMQLIPLESAKTMVSSLMGNTQIIDEEPGPAMSEPVMAPPPSAPIMPPEPISTYEFNNPTTLWDNSPADSFYANQSGVKKGQVTVQPVQFMPLATPNVYQEPRNIDLILDVPLDISVELGKTKKNIREILELGPGSIIQLDKLAGEPVDLLVNGKLIAKGEVVVIDENYGIRITAIVSPADRLTKLQ